MIEPTDEMDCCAGEPAFGDPQGLHTFDCPEYQRLCAALDRPLSCSGTVVTFSPAPCGRDYPHRPHDLGIPPVGER